HAIGFGAGSFIYYSGAAMDGRPLTFQSSRQWHGFTLGKSESEFKYGRRGMISHISHWPLGSILLGMLAIIAWFALLFVPLPAARSHTLTKPRKSGKTKNAHCYTYSGRLARWPQLQSNIRRASPS